MDDRPIGIFDSGVGGLTSINAFSEVLPHESIVYFGDTARAPYGTKSPATVRAFSREIADFLVKQGAKILVAACNTSSSIALDAIKEDHPDIPVVGVIKPCAARIAEVCTPENSIGVIATPVTVESGAYEKEIRKLSQELNVHSIGCSAFVPLIESGAFNTPAMDAAIKHTLDEFIRENQVDTLVLGCTHYPIIRPNIEKLFPWLSIIDPSMALAMEVRRILTRYGLLASEWQGSRMFYASDLSSKFLGIIQMLGISGDYVLKQHAL